MSPSLLGLFDQQVASAPHRRAFTSGASTASYADLDDRARQLSSRLAHSGAAAGSRIEVALAPEINAVVALLAVWRLGAVAVFSPQPAPVDGGLRAAADPRPPGDAGGDRPGQGSASRDLASRDPASRYAAFVDHCRPAARLLVSHRATANQVRWGVRRWAVSPEDRILCSARTPAQLCFEAFLALGSGASLIGPPAPADAAALAAAVADFGATIVPLPAGLADAVVLDASWQRSTQVRLILCEDSASLRATPPRWPGTARGEVWSLYGLATVGSVAAAGTIDIDQPDGGAVIGRPIDGVRLVLLDEFGEAVPPGIPGLLHLAGDCLPLGMDAGPEAVADRFLPDLLGQPGARMLCLGDWARWRSGGVLQWLDHPGSDPSSTAMDGRSTGPAAPPSSPQPLTAWETAVADVWSQLLGVTPAGAHDDFYALGGYSLLIPALAGRLRQVSGVDVSIIDLFQAATVAQQATLLHPLPTAVASGAQAPPDITAMRDAAGEVDPALDAVLDPSLVIPDRHPHTERPEGALPPRRVLLTGATGFLGTFLLAEILRTWPAATVVCLVRAAGVDQARARLEREARRYQVWTDAVRERVELLPGDLEKPRLGLTAEQFAELAGQLDLILHNGARVNLTDSYARVRAANVLGTLEVLRLAMPRATPVHLVSVPGVVGGTDDTCDGMADQRQLSADLVAPNGYVRSKWVAEELLRQAGLRGLPTAVYRPARISGHSISGATGPDDALWAVVKACIELGVAPDGPGWADLLADMVPVDYVARAIVRLCGYQVPDGTAYILSNPALTPVMAVLDRVRAAGYRLESLPGDLWADRLVDEAVLAGPVSALPVAAALVGRRPQLDRLVPLLRVDRTSTRRGLSGSGIECPTLGPELLDRYLRFFIESGAWPEPDRQLPMPGKDRGNSNATSHVAHNRNGYEPAPAARIAESRS